MAFYIEGVNNAGDAQMTTKTKTYRISGTNLRTGRFETANVQGATPEQARQLMAMTHRRMVVLDKKGVAL